MDVMVRPAAEADPAAITATCNHYMVASPATFDIEPVTDRRAWFEQYSERRSPSSRRRRERHRGVDGKQSAAAQARL